MATQPQPRVTGAPAAKPIGSETGQRPSESALVQSPPQLIEIPASQRTGSPVLRIPVEVDVAVPIRSFRVRNLLALNQGQVIETQWIDGDDLPLGARGAQLAWTEFEVIDQKLAVRITRLA
jgi:flagellar motor switch/type III secretory pathway protein FliN